MAIEATSGCKHTEELEEKIIDLLNHFRESYPNHEQAFLAVMARCMGSFMATHMINGVSDSTVESVVNMNMRYAIAKQIERQFEELLKADPNHPGTETKQ